MWKRPTPPAFPPLKLQQPLFEKLAVCEVAPVVAASAPRSGRLTSRGSTTPPWNGAQCTAHDPAHSDILHIGHRLEVGEAGDSYNGVLLPYAEGHMPAEAIERLDERLSKAPLSFCYDLVDVEGTAHNTPNVEDARRAHPERFDSQTDLPRRLEFPDSTTNGPWYERNSETGWFGDVYRDSPAS